MRCKRCGHCCTLLPVISLWEKIWIYLNGNSDFTEKDAKGRLCIKQKGKDCYFLGRENNISSCKIYNIRPKVCRSFPHTDIDECDIDKRSFKERITQK